MTEKAYRFYWRSAGGWGSHIAGHSLTVLPAGQGKCDLIIYNLAKSKRVVDQRYDSHDEAQEAARVWVDENIPKEAK